MIRKPSGGEIAKQLLIFMTHEDEKELSALLKFIFPGVVILDNNVWPTYQPDIASSIDQCKSEYAHLWNRTLFPDLPISRRPDGKFQGPTVGPVLQFVRCIQEGNVLRSGRIALGFRREDLTPAIDEYFSQIWRMVKKPATSRLVCVSPENRKPINTRISGYWAWPAAANWCLGGKDRLLRDRATQNFYLPAENETST